MKVRLLASLVAVAVVTTFPGCVTRPSDKPVSTIERIGPLAETTAYAGTLYYLLDHPKDAPTFRASVEALDALTGQDYVNVAQLISALQKLPVKELKDQKAQIIITSTVVLLDAYGVGTSADAIQNAGELRQFAQRIRNGIAAALGDQVKGLTPQTIQRKNLAKAQGLQ